MIQLALVRHAKAEYAEPGTADHDRPLSARGRRDAPATARRVMRTGVRPELLLTSTALRARETAEAFAEAFGSPLEERAELYGADGETLLQAARESGVGEVMIVAHDPGLSELVTELAGREVTMPTSAVAVFTWEDGDWDAVGTRPADDFTLTTPE